MGGKTTVRIFQATNKGNISHPKTSIWLRKGNSLRETDSPLIATQNKD